MIIYLILLESNNLSVSQTEYQRWTSMEYCKYEYNLHISEGFLSFKNEVTAI